MRIWLPLVLVLIVAIVAVIGFRVPAPEVTPSSSSQPNVDSRGGDPAEAADAQDASLTSKEKPSLSGTVLDAESLEPLAGAVVQLFGCASVWESEFLTETRSDASGRYELERPPGDPVWLEVAARFPGYVPFREHVGPRWRSGKAHLRTEIHLVPGNVIRGTVLLPNGEPAPEGVVTVRGCAPEFWEDGATRHVPIPIAEGGSFEVWTSKKSAYVVAHVPGFAPGFSDEIWVPVVGIEGIAVTVQEPVILRVRVLDPAGNGLGGASVTVSDSALVGDPFDLWHRRTDSEGWAMLQVVSSDIRILRVGHPDYPQWMQYDLEATNDPIEVRLGDGQWYVFELWDEGGEPIRGARGEFFSLRQGVRAFVDALEFKGHGSRYRSVPVGWDPGPVRLEVPGFVPKTLQLPAGPGEVSLGKIRLSRGNRLRVRVTDENGAPVSATVSGLAHRDVVWWAQGSTADTDADGWCELSGLPPGQFSLAVESRGRPRQEFSVTVEPGESEEVLVLDPGAQVRVRLLTPSGAPAEGAQAFLYYGFVIPDPDDADLVATAGSDGVAWFSAVRRDESYEVALHAEGAGSFHVRASRIGEADEADLGTLQFMRAAEISGVVVDRRGAPLPGATVRVSGRDHPEGQDSVHETDPRVDDDGSFRLSRLISGTYRLRAYRPGFVVDPEQPLAVELKAGERHEVVFRMQEEDSSSEKSDEDVGVTLEMHFPERSALSTALVEVGVEIDGTPSSHTRRHRLGKDKSLQVRAGATQGWFRVEETGYGEKILFDLEPGQIARYQLEPSPPLDPTVVWVHDSRGAPVVGARVLAGYLSDRWSLTDASGEALLIVPPDLDRLEIKARGFPLTEIENPHERIRDGVIEVTLANSGAIELTVGPPSDGYSATISSPALAFEGAVLERRDDTFIWNDLPEGSYRLKLFSRFGLAVTRDVEVSTGQTTRVHVGAPFRVVVRVVDPTGTAGEELLGKGTLRLDGPGSMRMNHEESGRYVGAFHEPGPYTLRYRNPELKLIQEEQRTLESGTEMVFELKLRPLNARLVLEDGSPLALQSGTLLGPGRNLMRAFINHFQTDAGGWFALDHMQPGLCYWELTTPPAGIFAEGAFRTRESEPIIITVPAAGTVTLEVEGIPPGAEWTLYVEQEHGMLSLGRSKGRSRTTLLPLGEQSIRAVSNNFVAEAQVAVSTEPSNFKLRFDARSKIMVFLDKEAVGNPKGARLIIRALDHQEEEIRDPFTAQGGFATTPLRPGRYLVRVELLDGRVFQREILLTPERNIRLNFP